MKPTDRMLVLAAELREIHAKHLKSYSANVWADRNGCPACAEYVKEMEAAKVAGTPSWHVRSPAGHTCEMEVVLMRIEQEHRDVQAAFYVVRNIMNDGGETHQFYHNGRDEAGKCAFCKEPEKAHPNAKKFDIKTACYEGKLAVQEHSGDRVIVCTSNLDYTIFRMMVMVSSWEEGCKMRELAVLIFRALCDEKQPPRKTDAQLKEDGCQIEVKP
jgi:hypothetical protein